MMQKDYFARFIVRQWHGDYSQPLSCPQYTATLAEKLDDRWIILAVTFTDGPSCFFAVMLKPDRWMNMNKNAASLPTDNFVGYTYNNDGPFGYRCKDLESAKERVYSLCERLRPVVVAPAPAPLPTVEEVVTPAPILKKKTRSYYQRKCERLRRLKEFGDK